MIIHHRRLLSRDFRARRRVKTPKLTAIAELRDCLWAQDHLNLPVLQWDHAVFCDDSTSCRTSSTVVSGCVDPEEKTFEKAIIKVKSLMEGFLSTYGVQPIDKETPIFTFWIRRVEQICLNYERCSLKHMKFSIIR